MFAVFTGLVAVSWNVLSLSVFRFLSNFGLGGEVPVTLTLSAEYSPGRIRGAHDRQHDGGVSGRSRRSPRL